MFILGYYTLIIRLLGPGLHCWVQESAAASCNSTKTDGDVNTLLHSLSSLALFPATAFNPNLNCNTAGMLDIVLPAGWRVVASQSRPGQVLSCHGAALDTMSTSFLIGTEPTEALGRIACCTHYIIFIHHRWVVWVSDGLGLFHHFSSHISVIFLLYLYLYTPI